MKDRSHNLLVMGINYTPEQTGIAPYTTAMARGLRRRGMRVRVMTTHPHYPSWKTTEGYGQWSRTDAVDGVRVDRLLHYVPRRPSGLRRALSEVTFGLRVSARRWGRPAAIISVSPALISTAIARARSLLTHRSTPFVVWVQDLYSVGLSEIQQGSSPVVNAMRAVEGWVLRSATQVIVVHERFAERVHVDFAVPRNRIRVIRNWTHLPTQAEISVSESRARFGWSPDETIVLHAGNMGVKQGLDSVVAAARLADKGSLPVRFVLLGDGSERDRLMRRADGVVRSTFLSPLPDADFLAALHAADILLVNERPGVAEMAVPSKLTSYFCAGRPVLAAADLAGITAAEIKRANAGVTVPPGDPRALLDGVLALRADAESAERYGRSAQRFRDAVLSEGGAIDSFDELLVTLSSRPRSKRAQVVPTGDRSTP